MFTFFHYVDYFQNWASHMDQLMKSFSHVFMTLYDLPTLLMDLASISEPNSSSRGIVLEMIIAYVLSNRPNTSATDPIIYSADLINSFVNPAFYLHTLISVFVWDVKTIQVPYKNVLVFITGKLLQYCK